MIYLDNAATTFPKPGNVLRAMNRYMRHLGGNPGRGGHIMSLRAQDIIYTCREKIAMLIGALPEEIVLTSSATFALNMAIKGVLKKETDHAILTCHEHNSVLRPVHKICRYSVCRSPDEARLQVCDQTKLLIVNHASNVCGIVQDLEGYKRVAKDAGVYLLVDATQTAGHIPVHVAGIDFLACAGHKALFGPQGTGFLYIKKGIEIDSLTEGGTGFMSESEEQPHLMPESMESGTLNGVGFAGLSAGISYVMKHTGKKEQMLNRFLKQGLASIPRVQLYSPLSENTVPVVAFNVRGVDCVELSTYLSEKHGICIRSGLHCAPLSHKQLNTLKTGTARVGLSSFNRIAELEKFLNCIDIIHVDQKNRKSKFNVI